MVSVIVNSVSSLGFSDVINVTFNQLNKKNCCVSVVLITVTLFLLRMDYAMQ